MHESFIVRPHQVDFLFHGPTSPKKFNYPPPPPPKKILKNYLKKKGRKLTRSTCGQLTLPQFRLSCCIIMVMESKQYGYTTPTRNRNVSQLYAISHNVGMILDARASQTRIRHSLPDLECMESPAFCAHFLNSLQLNLYCTLANRT